MLEQKAGADEPVDLQLDARPTALSVSRCDDVYNAVAPVRERPGCHHNRDDVHSHLAAKMARDASGACVRPYLHRFAPRLDIWARGASKIKLGNREITVVQLKEAPHG